jgi:hypothetical protein
VCSPARLTWEPSIATLVTSAMTSMVLALRLGFAVAYPVADLKTPPVSRQLQQVVSGNGWLSGTLRPPPAGAGSGKLTTFRRDGETRPNPAVGAATLSIRRAPTAMAKKTHCSHPDQTLQRRIRAKGKNNLAKGSVVRPPYQGIETEFQKTPSYNIHRGTNREGASWRLTLSRRLATAAGRFESDRDSVAARPPLFRTHRATSPSACWR